MMTLQLTATHKRLAAPTLETTFPSAFMAAARQLSELLTASYPREVRASELLPYDPTRLHDTLDRMGIGHAAN